jgi:serralysin
VPCGNNNDVLTGRLGADRFAFDAALPANLDKITDFTPAQGDKIVLDLTYFTSLGAPGTVLGAAHFHVGGPVGGAAQVVYTPGNGHLFYDSNGVGPGGSTHFATLTTHPVIHHTDFLLLA